MEKRTTARKPRGRAPAGITPDEQPQAVSRPLWWSESWSIDGLNDPVYDEEAWPEHPRSPEPPD